jgi:hypothetical protein
LAIGGHRCRMRLEKPPTREFIWQFGRLVIDAAVRCSHVRVSSTPICVIALSPRCRIAPMCWAA